jgi:hypothetical protein
MSKFRGFKRIGHRSDSYDFGDKDDYAYPVKYNDLSELSEYQLQRLFVDTIKEEADKADQLPIPIESYRILTDYLGRKPDGLRTQYGFGNALLNTHRFYPEKFIDLENVIIRANNPYRLWIKLYDYCQKQEVVDGKGYRSNFVDKYLLPLFDDNDYDIYGETTPLDVVNMVLKNYESCQKDNIYWTKLNEL